ncbi:hypothetical protein FSST1_010044 [Fusarium sambucinum]
MGGDEYWGEGGKASVILGGHGLYGDIKPLVAKDVESGQPYTLFELDRTYYFIKAADDSVERIHFPQSLGEILGTIGDPDIGLREISTETL